MNKYLSLALLASMMQFAHGAANDVTNVDGKVYVKPRAVRFMKKGIVVHTKDGAFVTPSVSRDENGLFVMQQDLVAAPSVAMRKKCGGCGSKRANMQKKWAHKGNGQGWKNGHGKHWEKRARKAQNQAAVTPTVEAPATAQ